MDAALHILRHLHIEYALLDEALRLVHCSTPLSDWMWQSQAVPEAGQPVTTLLPELTGMEAHLQAIGAGEAPPLRLLHLHRLRPDGQPGYVTVEAIPTPAGLLVLVRDTTPEGEIEQQLTQARNELALLSRELTRVSRALDDLIRRYVPSAVVDDLLRDQEKAAPGGERREVSVVFADLRGFTRWAERHSPEAVMAMLNQLWSLVLSRVALYGGTITQFMGDGVMILFNAPREQPDHPLQAVRCACALAEVSVHNLHLGLGVNTGPVVVGNIGSRDRLSYSAVGLTTNVAFRLQSMARPGEVLLSPTTWERVREHVPCRLWKHVQLKGLQAPINVYAVERCAALFTGEGL